MKFRSLGVMLDCSRDAVYSAETLKRYFGLLHKMGYTYVSISGIFCLQARSAPANSSKKCSERAPSVLSPAASVRFNDWLYTAQIKPIM